MPGKKSKKKTSGNERGFATTSVPAKTKEIATPDPIVEVAEPDSSKEEQVHPEIANERSLEDSENARILAQSFEVVETGTRLYNKLLNETEVEKRTRKSCCQLSLPEALIERILSLGNLHGRSSASRLDTTDALRYLYTAELMLRRTGICQSSISLVLSRIPDYTSTDALLYFVSRELKVSTVINHTVIT